MTQTPQPPRKPTSSQNGQETANVSSIEITEDFNTKPKPEVVRKNYNKLGELASEGQPIMAKSIATKDGDSESVKYRVVMYNNALYSPTGPYSNRENAMVKFFKYRDVSKDMFDMYVEFLKNRNIALFNEVSRKILNND
jgi:hypothetical protein